MQRWIRWSPVLRKPPVYLLVLFLCATAGLLVRPRFSQAQRGQGVRPVPAVGAGRYVALLIAVQNYDDKTVTKIDNPIRDAEQVRDVLTTEYQFEPGDVTLVKDPDRDTLLGALEDIAKRLQPNDRALIFFAGHGYWDEDRTQGYWLPIDARKGNRSRWISNSDIRDSIRAIKARHVLLISDACFSGSLFVSREAFARSAAVEEVDKLPSRTAMTSGALTTVPDRSVFLSYLLKKLRENQEPYFFAGDLYAQLRIPVINNNPRQSDGTLPTPRYGVIQEAGDEGGDFIFARRAAPPPPPIATTNRVEEKPPGPYRTAAFTTGKLRNGILETAQAQCDVFTEDLGGGVSIELVRIPAGRFLMGSPANEKERIDWEEPQHEVSLKGFLMGRYEVTQRQWRTIAGFPTVNIELNPDPSRFKGDYLPVELISWEEAKECIARLNQKLGLTGQNGYRLPSEAEWEYAARAGTETPFAFGPTITPEIVNYDGNYPYAGATKGAYREKTLPVGSLKIANVWGLFDMHGNVWEWCEDKWHNDYGGSPLNGTAWVDRPGRGSYRVIRGGGWSNSAVYCRSANRGRLSPGYRGGYLGFRLLRADH